MQYKIDAIYIQSSMDVTENKETWDLLGENAKNQKIDVFLELVRYFDGKTRNVNNYVSHVDPIALSKLHPICDDLEFDAKEKSLTTKAKKRDEIIRKNLMKEATKFIEYIVEHPYGIASTTNIVELVLYTYVHRSKYSKSKSKTNWFDSLISIRDGLIAFDNLLHPSWKVALNKYLNSEFCTKAVNTALINTNLLLRSNFKTHHDTAIRLYTEQANVLDTLKESNGIGLYRLSWGVGCGKTEMVPALATIANRDYNSNLIYAVSTGPIRDQMASLLLKCGIPFAFVFYISKNEKYELQPSFACKNGILPKVLISDYSFARKCYSEMLPSLIYPQKAAYNHINDETVWAKEYWLVMDEPDPKSEDVTQLLYTLPKTTILMSATSAGIATDEIINNYKKTYPEGEFFSSEGNTIGVSASLYACWVDPPQLLSPWHGCTTREEFSKRTKLIEQTPMLKRYISPILVNQWRKEFKSPFDVTLENLSYTSISDIGIAIANSMISDYDDDWFAENFCFPKSTLDFTLDHVIAHPEAFWGGSLIGVQDIDKSLATIASLITLPSQESIESKLQEKSAQIRKQIQSYQKRKKEKDEEPYVLPSIDAIPIDPKILINSYEFCQNRGYELKEYTLPLVPISIGSLEDPDGWKIGLDTTYGVSDLKENLRLVGVCNIDNNNLYNKKNMRDMINGHFTLTISDELGAFGLNMPMQNVVLLENNRPEIIQQLAGRVGRASQKDAGRIFIKDLEIFNILMTCATKS